jgi:hypothetical protein
VTIAPISVGAKVGFGSPDFLWAQSRVCDQRLKTQRLIADAQRRIFSPSFSHGFIADSDRALCIAGLCEVPQKY